MGKSPGRWIKTVLFGKLHLKSGLSKTGRHGKKDVGKTSSEDLSGKPLITSNSHVVTDDYVEKLELENNTSGISCNIAALIPVNQDVESQTVSASLPISDAEMRIRGQAAAKVQAAFRGYLARRAFWALKGIIRLQALIRGHLVRRQAVATLRCMQAVVKLQAMARGQRLRLSGAWPGIHRKCNIGALKDAKQADVGAKSLFMSERQAANAYIRKLLLLLPAAIPLSLQYDLAEPNSSWNWLERWSLSRFWEPPARSRNISNAKPQRKQGGSQTVDNEAMKSKRTIGKAPVSGNEDNGALASFETDKQKRNPRINSIHPTELVHELPKNELERVKRNLRKVSVSATPASDKSEMETEKPQQLLMNFAPPNTSEKEIVISDHIYSDVVEKQALVEAPSKTLTMEESVKVLHDNHSLMESHSLENGSKMETTQLVNEEKGSREDESGRDNLKVRKRRSLPAKQEYIENISQNTLTLPSYMAATESAKAKLRAQGCARFSEDGAEHGYVRRHSLPASTNSKLSSMSPRMQKPAQANGKGSSKTNRTVPSSRDDKVLQRGWRR